MSSTYFHGEGATTKVICGLSDRFCRTCVCRLYALAEPHYKRALAIWEKALGPDHPIVATGLNNIAGLYRAMERDTEAAVLEQRAARIEAIQR